MPRTATKKTQDKNNVAKDDDGHMPLAATAGTTVTVATNSHPTPVTPDKSLQQQQQLPQDQEPQQQPPSDDRDPKRQKVSIWHFELSDGSTSVSRDDNEAYVLMAEFGDMLKSHETFTTEEDYTAFLERQKANAQRNPPNKHTPVMNPVAHSNANEVLANYHKYKAKNKLKMLFRTLPISTIATVIVQFLDIKGRSLFYAKPRNLIPYAKSYFHSVGWREIPFTEDPIVREMIDNMGHAKVRDPDGPPIKVLATKTKRGNYIDEETTITELRLPDSKIDSMEKEDEHIRKYLKLCGESILAAFATDSFKVVMENAMSTATFEWMHNKGFTFQHWCQQAEIEVERINNINTYVVLDDANKIKKRMLENKCPMRYIPAILPETSAIRMQMKDSPLPPGPTSPTSG